MNYQVQFSRRALRKLESLPKSVQADLAERITSLGVQPRPPGTMRMRELPGCYRIRHGNYRVVYAIRDKVLVVLILTVGDRKSVYEPKEIAAIRKDLKT